jgi:hypothetical protein
MKLKFLFLICLSFPYSLNAAAPIFKQPLHPVSAASASPARFEILSLITRRRYSKKLARPLFLLGWQLDSYWLSHFLTTSFWKWLTISI